MPLAPGHNLLAERTKQLGKGRSVFCCEGLRFAPRLRCLGDCCGVGDNRIEGQWELLVIGVGPLSCDLNCPPMKRVLLPIERPESTKPSDLHPKLLNAIEEVDGAPHRKPVRD